eukprot:scaffold41831_cov73-Phaeocystis_antarctica.AAC.8
MTPAILRWNRAWQNSAGGAVAAALRACRWLYLRGRRLRRTRSLARARYARLRSRGDKHGRKAGFISCVTKFRSIQHAREKTACGTVHYTNTHSISSLQIRPAHQLSRLYLASSLQLVKRPTKGM